MGEKINTAAAKGRPVVVEEVTVKLRAAQMLTLNATPVLLVRAQPGDVIIPLAIAAYKPAGTAYAGIAAGEDFQIEDTDGLSLGTLEATGFLDQATEQYRYSSFGPVTAKATGKGKSIRLKMLAGEITTGDSPVTVSVAFYRVELGRNPTIGN